MVVTLSNSLCQSAVCVCHCIRTFHKKVSESAESKQPST